jgi:hypothetical protein
MTDTPPTPSPDEDVSVGFEYAVAELDRSELAVTVSSANEIVTGTIAVVEPASFEVAFGSVPKSVSVGEALMVPVVVTNAGDVSGTRTVTVTVDGDPINATELSLAPDGDETVSFEYTAAETEQPGTDSSGVECEPDSDPDSRGDQSGGVRSGNGVYLRSGDSRKDGRCHRRRDES